MAELELEADSGVCCSVDITKRVMEITNGEGVKCVVDGIGKV